MSNRFHYNYLFEETVENLEADEEIYQLAEDFRMERKKIIHLLKNWHTRVQHRLSFDANIDTVKKKWTRFLDIDLCMDLDESADTGQINEMFKEVVAFLEAKQPFGAIAESDHNYHSQEHLASEPSSSHVVGSTHVSLSDEATKQLKEANQRLKGYLESSLRRMSRQKSVRRRNVLTSCNSFIATSAMLRETDLDIVERIIKQLELTKAELVFLEKRTPILSQHLKEQAPSVIAPITATDVKWEKFHTQNGRPMLQVDGYLFYVCPRNNKKTDTTMSYFKCLMNTMRKVKKYSNEPKCPVRIHLNCRNEVIFPSGREHCHPPDAIDISKYSRKLDKKSLDPDDSD